MKRSVFFISAVLLFSISLFAEVTVVNPVAGNFANPQTLVIESNGGEEIYYSFSGTDPLSSGFAYDGPVLLDVTGNVELRVVYVDQGLKRNEIKVNYTVTPATTQNAEHKAFLNSLEKGPLVEYISGNKIAIPFTMKYSFGARDAFETGKEISISKKSSVERYLPFNVCEQENVWRYVLHIVPAVAGKLSQRKVPFRVFGWTKLTFTDPKMIYSLDGSWWRNYTEVIDLDRSKANTVYFQSADYSPENPVTKILLPPKPELNVERQFDGGVKISVGGNYKIASSGYSKTRIVAPGLYSEILLDTFDGDKIEDLIPFDVYSDDVYQGTLFASVELSRSTPNVPVIRTTAQDLYSREDVEVMASAPKNLKVFVGISNPIEIKPTFEIPDLEKIDFGSPTFSAYSGNRITLFGDTERILAYKVSFYSEDTSGIKSPTVSYSVIIDKYNYYVDSSSQAQEQNGTPYAPFKDLSMLTKIANNNKFSRFCIKGEAQLSPGEASLNSNVEFMGMKDAKIVMGENSVILLKNAGLYSENVIWKKTLEDTPSKKPRGAAKALTNMFIIENSAATFKNCEIICDFAGDGTVLNLMSSALSMEKTVVVSNAQGYSSAVASLASKIRVFDARVLCIADTAVGFSINGGNFDLSNTFVQVTARMARVAELIDTTVSLLNNKFTAEVSPPNTTGELIYKTDGTTFTVQRGNIIQ